MAKKRLEEGDRGVGRFRSRDPATRENSASIRRLLYDIIKFEFGDSLAKASAGLSRALNQAEDQRRYRRRAIKFWSAFHVLRDHRTISFNELDSMGLFHRVPLALVVLFTQARSEVQNDPNCSNARALHTLRAFRHALAELEQIVEAMPEGSLPYDYLNYAKFLRVRDAYHEEFGEFQADLPLPENRKR